MYVEDQSGNLIQNLGDFSEYTGKPWKFRKNIMSYGDIMYGGYLWDMKDNFRVNLYQTGIIRIM